MMSWVLGAVLASAVLVLAAGLAERALAGLGLPRRWPWVVALVAGAGLPLAGRWLPALPVGEPLRPDQLSALLAGGAAPALPVPAGGDWTKWAAAAWLVASAALLLLLLYTGLRLARARRGWLAAEVEGGGVLVSAGAGPAVVGLLRPAVVVPAWVLTAPAQARRMVLAHEREHVRAGDPWLLAGAAVVTALLPWNPALWWAQRRLRLALESDCDARVLASGVDRTSYGTLLLHTAAQGGSWAPTLALVESKTSLERRIRAMTRKLPKNRALAAVTLSAAAVLAVVACDLAAPTGEKEASAKTQPAAQAALATPAPPPPAAAQVRKEGASEVGPVSTPVVKARVFVDGVEVPAIPKFVDESRIERVDVLKTEAARRFYAEKHMTDDGRGVILITTKNAARR